MGDWWAERYSGAQNACSVRVLVGGLAGVEEILAPASPTHVHAHGAMRVGMLDLQWEGRVCDRSGYGSIGSIGGWSFAHCPLAIHLT